jgi:predicted alpha-1,6-mannanase (GH76 family)
MKTKLIAVAVVSLSLGSAANSVAQSVATYHNQADQALQSFLVKFWNGGQQYLRNKYPDDGSLSSFWTYANGWDAVMDGVERTGGQQYAGMIETLYLGQNERTWTNDYFDDECWMTLALIRAYDLTSNSNYLNQAESIYADIQTGWETNCCGATPGGVWWDKAHTQKATASNAGAALAGVRLYRRTASSSYLTFAQQVYSYWFSNMVDSSTFQVIDHIQFDGTKVLWRFTYNEGLMIGASVELSAATGNASYLTNANNIAGFMISNEVTPTSYGKVLYDGTDSGCGGDCHQFKGPAYRYLSLLYAVDTSKTNYYNVLKASADAIWNRARDTNATIFAVNWAGPVQSTVDELQDNAACMALNRFAELYGTYPGPGIPANQYEAENGVLHNIGLEANGSGFTGWGYIAGWNGDGQWVDFKVNCALPGLRTLAFRYAAGAGDASRLIYINGSNVFPNLSFPGTGAWTTYNTVIVSNALPAGMNTISVIYNSSLGNSNFLNLDNMTVTDMEQFQITGINLSPTGTVHITWGALSGQTYSVQYKNAATDLVWTNSGGPVTATGTAASVDAPAGTNSERFYRITEP